MDISWKEIRFYYRLIRRWSWLFLMLMLTSALVSAHVLRAQPRVYATFAVVGVGSALLAPNPDPTGLQVGTALTLYYAKLARRTPIVQSALERQQIPLPADLVIEKMLFVRPLAEAQQIEIEVVDTDPNRAAAIANALAEELVRQSPASESTIEADREFARERLNEVRQRIDERRAQIAELQQRIKKLTSSAEIADTTQQIAALEHDLNTLENSYRVYSQIIISSSVNTLALFEPAWVPEEPLPVKTKFTIILAAVLGITLAGLGVVLLERLDSRWSPDDDLELLLGAESLAVLPPSTIPIVSEVMLASQRGQAVRELRTQLLFQMVDRPVKTLMVCSVHNHLARTAVSADLATVFALSGQRVMLVDVRLSEAQLSRAFVPVMPGGWRRLLHNPTARIEDLSVPTRIEGLRLMPGAPDDMSTAPELLPSLHWNRLALALSKGGDLVVFDGPPALDTADAALLAPLVDGVILVIDPGADSRKDIRRTVQLLSQDPSANFLGFVVVAGRRPRLLRRWFGRKEKAYSPAAMPDSGQSEGEEGMALSPYLLVPIVPSTAEHEHHHL